MKKITIFIISFFLCLSIVDAKKMSVQFSECTDGDTASFLYNGKEIKARFLAVDTPETKHPTIGEEPWGKEASEYTCNKLKNANKIVLEYDDHSDEKDKYDRHLVWVWVDNSLLQKQLINKGYAEVAYLYDDYKYTEELQKAQETAKKKKIGLWSDEDKVITSNSNTKDKNSTKEYEQLINALLYTKDGKLNYVVITITVIIIILLCIFSTKFRNNTVKTIKKEIKKKL